MTCKHKLKYPKKVFPEKQFFSMVVILIIQFLHVQILITAQSILHEKFLQIEEWSRTRDKKKLKFKDLVPYHLL